MSGEVPEGWREATIADIATLSAGGTPKREIPEYYQGGHIPWVKSGELRNGTIFDTEEKITEEGLVNSSTKLIPANTPIIAMYGATAGVVGWLGVKAATNQAVLAALVKPDVNSRYVYHLLLGASAKLIERQQGGAQPNLSKQLISSFLILLPPLPEQQRIAEILSSVDESIRATEAVIAQAERVKRGLMEDLLTGGLGSAAIANGEVPEGWASDKFINLITLKRGYDLPVTDRIDGNFLVVASNGPVGTHNIPAVSGPVIVTGRSGTIGKVELYWEDCHPLNTTLYSQNLHGNDPRYVAEYIRFFRLERFATGTGVPTLNRNLVHDETIVIPPLPEQQRIAEILSSVDDQITTNRATVEQLQRLKRGLMDDLLTGKVRTVA